MIRKRAFLIFIITMLLISTTPGYSYALLPSDNATLKAVASPAKYKEGELLVKFKPGVKRETKAGIHAKLGSKVLKDFNYLSVQHIQLRSGEDIETAIEKYKNNPNVEYAEPNYIFMADVIPRDADFAELWALNNTGQTGGMPDADIDGPEAWDITTGSSNVVVAVIDTGVNYTHEDLSANMWVNAGEKAGDGLDNDGNGFIDDIHGMNAITGSGDPMDDHFHGTHVAGTIGAVGNNRKGVTGVNWNVKIMALKFLDSSGSGSDADAIECFEYVRMMKAKGVNIVATSNSWGGTLYVQALYDAISAQQDILCVAAAGNQAADNGLEPHWPAAFDLPNLVAVAATDKNDSMATWSNYGRSSVHIGAPGVDILSTWLDGGYGSLSGTSMAAPHVSGVTALLKAQDPNRSSKTIKNLLLTGGDTISSLDGKTMSGKRLNAYGSLTKTDGAVISALTYPLYPTADSTYTLSALSLKGAATVGPVTVTANGSQVAVLYDNGVAPDNHADDGIFSATWTARTGNALLTFSSGAGSQTINVNPLVITRSDLNYATIGKTYSDYLKARGGTTLYAWSVVSGTLPPGLSLNASTGELSGIPTNAGKYEFTVQVTDGEQTATQVAKVEADYDEVWFNSTDLDDRADGMATDANGNVYVVGQVKNGDNYNCNLVKFTPAGAVAWVRTYDGGGSDFGKGVAVDASGNVYMTGFTQKATYDVFITVKYDSQGNIIWQKETDNNINGQRAESVALDSAGNIIIAGNASTLPNVTVLAKLNQDGNLLWFKQVSGVCDEIALDANDNICITGGGISNPGQTTKCDSQGNVLWTQPFTIGLGGTATDIGADAGGNIYVTGYYTPASATRDILTLKYDSAGNLLWSKTYATGGNYMAKGITVDASGVSYIAATGDVSINTAYCLAIKYDAQGNQIISKERNVSAYEYSEDIVVDSSGNILIAGYARAGAVDPEVVPPYDVFVIKYGDLEPPTVTAFDVPGACYSLTVPVNTFTASDNKGVAGYMITESSVKPGADDSRWSTTAPASYTVSGEGTYTLYAWAKDGSRNVSSSASDTVNISFTVNTIAVTKAEYGARTKTLTVYATSNYGANAVLQLEGYGAMTWNAKFVRWERIVTGLAGAPATVTVSGPEGNKTATVTVK